MLYPQISNLQYINEEESELISRQHMLCLGTTQIFLLDQSQPMSQLSFESKKYIINEEHMLMKKEKSSHGSGRGLELRNF